MRWFLRFRLRTLLVFVACLSILLAWYVANAREKAEEAQALRELQDLLGYEGIVSTAEDEDFYCLVGVKGTVYTKSPMPMWARPVTDRLGGQVLCRVDEAHFYGPQFDDRFVEHIARFKSITRLTLSQTQVSEECIADYRRSHPNVIVKYDPPEVDLSQFDFGPGGFF